MQYKIEKEKQFEIVVKVYEVPNGKGNEVIPAMWEDYLAHQESILPGMLGVCLSEEVRPTTKGTFAYGIGNKKFTDDVPEGFETIIVPEGLWGKFYTKGAMPNAIQALWKEVLQNWLPNSGYSVVGNMDFEWYTDGDTSSNQYESAIWLMLNKN